ncbi:PqiC family protein [Silvimonas soli]|uniref:PqiC family protein n=1 Tax=Silvimonas soli TaxID=2980100 RepID=UPI0024B34B57|nr:PqiC family protein [Silvimonas soli]
MIRPSLNAALTISILALALAGCGSAPPEYYYSLNPVAAPATTSAPANLVVAVAAVTVPAVVDRPQFVLNQPDHSLTLLEQQRWAAPLKSQIPAVLAVDLARLLGTPNVTGWPQLALPNTNWTVAVGIQRFESQLDKTAVIEAVWQVVDKTNTPVQSGRNVIEEPVQGTGYAALAAAHDRALAKLAQAIAAAIPGSKVQ